MVIGPINKEKVNMIYRHTKIVATVGPACESEEMLTALMTAGTDVFRLNFSHGKQAQKQEIIQRIRDISKKMKKSVAILGDLQGPKIRVGLLAGGCLKLVEDQVVTISPAAKPDRPDWIPTTYQNLPQDVQDGDQILLDDGLLELQVIEVVADEVRCRVVIGGLLKNNKGINLPGVAVSAPALTDKDNEDLKFCISEGVDYLALSFVRTATDVTELKRRLFTENSPIRVIAKIEKPEAVENFDAILAASDGIMVARGDLGVEILPEKVPLIQKRIIRACNAAGKPVITATQMLESMISNPRPTRAETSDVANAILDGTDAIMLSGETAAGEYPIEAVRLMVRVAADIEEDRQLWPQAYQNLRETGSYRWLPDAIGQAACRVAEMVGATAILAFTQTGSTAALVAKYRPELPVYAVTPSQSVRRRMALYRSVRSIRVDIEGDTEAQIRSVEQAVLDAGVLARGDVVVITMGSPVSDAGTTNMMKVHRLGTGDFFEVY
jgi:pyruvate kinase